MVIKDFIYESNAVIFEKIDSFTDITEFNFLNMSFLLKNIIKDTLNDISQYLLTKSDEIIKIFMINILKI